MPDETRTHAPAPDGTQTFGPPADATGAFAPSAAADAPAVATLPGYEVLESIGSGGMGRVFRARQLSANRVVAVKLILAGEFASQAARDRFKAEIETTARLSHPHIVQLYEAGEADGRAFLSVEFMPGGSLAARLDGTPWDAKRAARLLVPLARAVAHAHAAGVVHRDLKPANILLAADGSPKVADFGIAKQLGSDSQTHTGAVLGTPSYMPPEQAGSAKAVGPPADVYALGAILYELLTGRPPFKGADFVETIDLVRTQEPVPPRVLSPKVPRDAETVCLKCLQKDPAKRYASANDLADDLERFLDGRPIVARPVGGAERAWRWCRRNPAVASLLATVLLVFATGAGVASYFAVQADRRATDAAESAKAATDSAAEARRERDNVAAEREKAEELLYGARIFQSHIAANEYRTERLHQLLDEMRPPPDRPDRRGWEWHYLNRLAHSWDREQKLDPISVENDHSAWWRFSSDRTRAVVAFNRPADNRVVAAGLYDLATGRRVRDLPQLKSSDSGSFFASFSSDLRFAVRVEEPVGGPNPTPYRVRLFDLDAGTDELVMPEAGRNPQPHSVSGGRVVAFVAGDPRPGDSNGPALLVWERGRGVRRVAVGNDRLTELRGVGPDGNTAIFSIVEPAPGGSGPGVRKVQLWDITDKPARRADLVTGPAGTAWYPEVGFGPGGRVVAVVEPDAVGVYDARTGDRVGRWAVPRDALPAYVGYCHVSDDGTRVMLPGKEGGLVVGERVGNTLENHFDPNSKVAARDPVGVWRSAVVRASASGTGGIPALSGDGRRLLVGDGSVLREWDAARAGGFVATWPEYRDLGRTAGYSVPDSRGRRVLYRPLGEHSVDRQQSIRLAVLDPARPDAARTFDVTGWALPDARVLNGTRVLLTLATGAAGPDGWPMRWSLRAADDPAKELAGGPGTPAASDHTDYFVVTAAGSKSVRAHHTADGRATAGATVPPNETLLAGWVTPAGALVLATHPPLDPKDATPTPVPLTLRFFDAETGVPRGAWVSPARWTPENVPLGDGQRRVRTPRPFYSADGRRMGLARAEPDGVRAWVLDAASGTVTAEHMAAVGRPSRSNPFAFVPERADGAFGPGGQVAAWAGADVVLWPGAGAAAVRLTGHTVGTAVTSSADGRRAFTLDAPPGDADYTLRVWNAVDGRELMALRFPSDTVAGYRPLLTPEMWVEGERIHVLMPTGVRVFDGTPLKE